MAAKANNSKQSSIQSLRPVSFNKINIKKIKDDASEEDETIKLNCSTLRPEVDSQITQVVNNWEGACERVALQFT